MGEVLLDHIGVRRGLIHFVDGDDDRHAGSLGMVDGFHGLRHDTVVGGNDQNGDIGRLRAAGAHCREGFMPRGIKEGDFLAGNGNAVCADRLSETARFACGDGGMADGVEQGGFAVVDMAHNAYDRVTRDKGLGRVLAFVEETLFDSDDDSLLRLAAHFIGNEESGIEIDDLVCGRHDAKTDQLFDYDGRGDMQKRCKLVDGDFFADGDLSGRALGFLRSFAAHFCKRFTLFFLIALFIVNGFLILLFQLLFSAGDVACLFRRKAVKLFIIFGQIDAGGAGVDQARFPHARGILTGDSFGHAGALAQRGGGLLRLLSLLCLRLWLRLFCQRICIGKALCLLLCLLLRLFFGGSFGSGAALLLLLGCFLCSLGSGFFLFRFFLCGSFFLRARNISRTAEVFRHIRNLSLRGQRLKHEAEFLGRKHGGMGFSLNAVLCQKIGDGFVFHTEILCHRADLVVRG